MTLEQAFKVAGLDDMAKAANISMAALADYVYHNAILGRIYRERQTDISSIDDMDIESVKGLLNGYDGKLHIDFENRRVYATRMSFESFEEYRDRIREVAARGVAYIKYIDELEEGRRKQKAARIAELEEELERLKTE